MTTTKKTSFGTRLRGLWSYFTLYEKIWFFSILIISVIFAFVFPEEDMHGINGRVIMVLYLLDTFLNILCELLISKQSKWNFIVSLLVELSEIAICIVTMARFSTMATTIFFWIPIDILSFVNWHRHPDKEDEEITTVRKLSGRMLAAWIVGIAVWTVGAGYFTADWVGSAAEYMELYGGNETVARIVCYFDACVSALGIANGVFILLRFREQWIAWYLYTILEIIIIILSGQYVMLVLSAGFLTNTTYGYLKWTKYIREHKDAAAERSLL